MALDGRLESARAARERARAETLSVEALQRAALGRADARAGDWLRSAGLDGRPRVAESLVVEPGWERAVETVLGDDLEAVCIDELDSASQALESLGSLHLALFESGAGASPDAAEARHGSEAMLASRVRGPGAALDLLAGVRVAETLAGALVARRTLGAGESLITRGGEWVGRGWLRVARGADARAGVLEREQRLKSLRQALQSCDAAVHGLEAALVDVRVRLAGAEADRDGAQGRIQRANREHADLLGQLEGARARAQEATLRRERIEDESADVARDLGAAEEALGRSRGQLERGRTELDGLDARRPTLEAEREERRDAVARARSAAEAAQLASRDLMVRAEGRRSTEGSMEVGLGRMREQREFALARIAELESELADGDAPVLELEGLLGGLLARRLEVESDLALARRALEDADAQLRALDERRQSAEIRVNAARDAMEQARLAAQETRVRRESIAEQFAATQFDLAELQAGLTEAAEVVAWESRLVEVRSDIDRLGQVNLAAIDELQENTERKEYLDRQFADLTSALETLEQAMRKIDKETRTRFEDTFNQINAGLQEKFPRLFGGGHAYLELVGDDPLSAGVAVMARPPGKRNVTISQLSGGEKALTAVALVFSIFDLNPAPFCLLDEVDAPLDENNVGRFCDIVRDMAQRVQFIFITHNKSTMELASQLLGVTMNEPGVSRLVAVDVDEAVRLAAS
jgi:chromosome segregation protein